MSLFSGKKIFLLGFIIVLLFAIPITVFLTQKQQQTQSNAAPSTTLSFSPTSASVNVGQTTNFDINMQPGTNQVSFIKLVITYDPSQLSVDPKTGLIPNSIFTVLQGPVDAVCSDNSSLHCLTVTLSVGSNPSAVISSDTKIATLTVKGVSPSTASVGIDASQTQVLSIGASDQANENVLLGQPAPATVTVSGAPSSSSTSSSNNTAPTCSSLVLDRSSTGTAPYALTFTASGTDSDGTISKATFNFGDGQQQDVTTGGGIGTNSVNVQISHQYNNPGTYNASAVLTDNQGATSSTDSCKVTVTVNAASGSTGGTTGSTGGTTTSSTGGVTSTESATVTPIIQTTITPTITLPPTGPGEKILGVGVAGIALSVIGGFLLLGL